MTEGVRNNKKVSLGRDKIGIMFVYLWRGIEQDPALTRREQWQGRDIRDKNE